jgi:hypothetical protein
MLKCIGPEDIYGSRDKEGQPTGYAHPSYIQALSEFGTPIGLARGGAWLLSRPIPGTDQFDAIGAYPFFTCNDYKELRSDFAHLRALVSVGVVPDLFSFGRVSVLAAAFDFVIPFKTHYLADLEIGFGRYVRRHHRRYASKGLSNFDVELVDDPTTYSAEWTRLHQNLVVRHRISGLSAFSPKSLARQLSVPGCLYFRALRDATVQGALVCYLDRGVAYTHLIATTAMGQELCAQYALYWTAIEHCRGQARWVALGSIPGVSSSSENSGLSFFKAGWATATCQGFFCGHVLDRDCYEALCASLGRSGLNFPSYRKPPFR